MLCRPISAGLVLTTTLGGGVSLAATDLTRSPIVVCTREVGRPWSLIAHGDLVRIRLANRIEYQLEVRGQTFLYSVESRADGSTQMSFPTSLSLIRPLVEKSPDKVLHEGRLSYRGPPTALALIVRVTSVSTPCCRQRSVSANNCRRVSLSSAGEELRPNPQIERDASQAALPLARAPHLKR